MAVKDEEWVLQDAALSSTTGTVVSDDSHQLQLDAGNIGSYDFASTCKKFARMWVGTAFAGATSVQFQVISADDEALTTNVTVMATSTVVALADLLAGPVQIALDPDLDWREHVGFQFVVVGTITGGAAATVHADLADHADAKREYADKMNFGVNDQA